ncbi:MAG: hypothetical protein R2828_01145 [Saprospiraceae bacterium]
MDKHRRIFLLQSGIIAAGSAALPASAWANNWLDRRTDQTDILAKLSALNDQIVENQLPRQISRKGDRWDGGLPDEYELPNAHATTWFIIYVGTAYASPNSVYFESLALEQPLERAISCLLNVQYEDGTIDLHSTNFHSTPDTAFLVNYLSPVYVCLKRMNKPGLAAFIQKMAQFFKNAGKCLLVGGIHTANHRWVVSSALARLHSFFPSQEYVDRIDEWLSEGIDLDPDGQYTEHSVGTYSPTCNNMFITISRLLGRPELLEVVRKNLEMSLYYIQPGGEVLTDASGRQDKAEKKYVDPYYYAYKYLAIQDKNAAFSAVCALIEAQMPEKVVRQLAMLLEDKHFEKPVPSPSAIPVDYFKRFSHSGVFRIRKGETDLSVIEKNPTFLSFIKGKAVMQSLRLAASFFAKAQFEAEAATVESETIILKKTVTRGYYQPFPKEKRTGDGDWEKMPRDERTLSEAQTLDMTVRISGKAGRVAIEMEISGTPHVPVALEMSFRAGGQLSGVSKDERVEDAFFLESGFGEYRVDDDVISFGPGRVTHKWSQMRGMLPKQDGLSVYLTGYTPFNYRMELK